MIRTKVILAGVAALFVATPRVHAQSAGSVDCSILTAPAADHATMDHSAHAQITKECSARLPVSAGQAAYGAAVRVDDAKLFFPFKDSHRNILAIG